MLQIGVQTKNVVYDSNPAAGFQLLKKSGFSCADFSLNSYLLNTSLYKLGLNDFFNKSDNELEAYFRPHKKAAENAGITINQMHMPYPCYVPNGSKELNNYLVNVVAKKSMKICELFGCSNIVVHGFKLARNLGSEELEWKCTEDFLNIIAPLAKEMKITICVENIYTSIGNHILEGPCCNVQKAVERIDRFNDKYGAEILGFCFDTGHAKLVGIDFEDFITTLGNRLKVLHIHDNDGIGDLHQIPFTFTKTRENRASTDWNGFIQGLKNIKYDKVLSFETAPVLTSFPAEMKSEVLQFIAKIGHYFSNKIES
ncbi:sugar phosphate isomerase/epimerase family protein [Clostridium thermarum]|uniref:sugar phosphate isomerase/epimerase family protein n=1 Tax=Clostridium thermarum TaxID=1716543 RepID=UPI0013D1E789|nr:sugar phosphate isomerase/epimerase [Clostridium thermarum]